MILAAILANFQIASPQEFLIPVIPNISNTGGVQVTHPNNLKASVFDTLELPFFDDFSKNSEFPDNELWTDTYAFINNSYSDNPVSIGIATLDAINSEGTLNGETGTPFPSDYLTSMPINLNYPGRTDIYLSFFYQPQGLGDEPEEWDSLIVEFYSPSRNEWRQVWSTEGRPAEPFNQVFIPVSDTIYQQTGFRFRFMNYASLPKSQSFPSYNSNVDHWNIDYVCLDTARSPSNNAIPDVSMITNLQSLLKNYEAIPWRHFSPNVFNIEIRNNLKITYRNNDTLTRNVTRFLKITDLVTDDIYLLNGGAVNVEKGVLGEYEFAFSYPFDFYEMDSTVFEVKSYLKTDPDDYKQNDTVVNYQVFHDYYAYDDGSAEFGYGISGEGTQNAALAYQFNSYEKDTLRAVRMYFNRSLEDISQDYFLLSVWDNDDDLDRPGELIYSMQGYRPEYQDDLNKFHTYTFDTILLVSEIFYVGWIQTTTDLLNIGFDRNKNNRNKIFYNLGQEWKNSSFNGSLMIRPVLGKELGWPVSVSQLPETDIRIYPNPASDFVRVTIPVEYETQPFNISIYTLQGSLVYQNQSSDKMINVNNLLPGMYLLRIDLNGMKSVTAKLLISR
jgi:hypothetical protein